MLTLSKSHPKKDRYCITISGTISGGWQNENANHYFIFKRPQIHRWFVQPTLFNTINGMNELNILVKLLLIQLVCYQIGRLRSNGSKHMHPDSSRLFVFSVSLFVISVIHKKKNRICVKW